MQCQQISYEVSIKAHKERARSKEEDEDKKRVNSVRID
jgi:hypothetical protein